MKIINEYWLQSDNGQIIELSPKEVSIVKILLKDEFISYKKICELIYLTELDNSYIPNIRLFITRLNKKINKYIKLKNRRKIGYYVEK